MPGIRFPVVPGIRYPVVPGVRRCLGVLVVPGIRYPVVPGVRRCLGGMRVLAQAAAWDSSGGGAAVGFGLGDGFGFAVGQAEGDTESSRSVTRGRHDPCRPDDGGDGDEQVLQLVDVNSALIAGFMWAR